MLVENSIDRDRPRETHKYVKAGRKKHKISQGSVLAVWKRCSVGVGGLVPAMDYPAVLVATNWRLGNIRVADYTSSDTETSWNYRSCGV